MLAPGPELSLDDLLKKNEEIQDYIYDPGLVDFPEFVRVEFETYFSKVEWDNVKANRNAVYTNEDGKMIEVFVLQLKEKAEKYSETLKEEMEELTGYHTCACLIKEDFALFLRTPGQNASDLLKFEDHYRTNFGMRRLRKKADHIVDLGI